MCGLVGYIGHRDALAVVMNGLEKLEYRGYDSAGVALVENGKVYVTKAQGKLTSLATAISERARKADATVGIGHTRWATHGAPSWVNAHPHTAGQVSVIHNGIIENYGELREQLSAREGVEFESQTDSEVAAHIINQHLDSVDSDEVRIERFAAACRKLSGSYAILALDQRASDQILISKTATPLIVGLGERETFIASDIPAILPYTREVVILEDGDVARVRADGVVIYNGGKPVERPVQRVTWDLITAQKGGYKHYMLKEIYDQVVSVSDTLVGRIDSLNNRVFFKELEEIKERLPSIERVLLVGCGTARHAGLVGKYFVESIAGVPCEVDYASEFRYRQQNLNPQTLVVAISQSGETADTIAAVEAAGSTSPTLAICNVQGSTLTRKCGATLLSQAGPEISVASTKAFTSQLVLLYSLALYLGNLRGHLSEKQSSELINDLVRLPSAVDEVLKVSHVIEKVACQMNQASSVLFLGRGLCYPIALEGALKLKEISYIHAEGYPAGEIKHGPLALIDHKVPVVFLLHREDKLFEKTFSNLREVHARQGQVIAVTDNLKSTELEEFSQSVITVPFLSHWLTPILMTIPLQFLAYHIAVLNGTDVDLPRNLAKSVTVE